MNVGVKLMNIKDKKLKVKAINYFLNEVLNKKYSMDIRKEEMLRQASKFCKGFPEWSDFWGNDLKPIDDISKNELKILLNEIQ